MMQRFRLAPMSAAILVLTIVLLALPVVFLLIPSGALGGWLRLPAVLLVVIYGWVWLWFRPSAFVIHANTIEVLWPLRRRQLQRQGIMEVRLIDREHLREKVGRAMRVGAGGLWGGFGWLWTEKLGVVQMYVSRTDGLVWIERRSERAWLITPEHPTTFVRALGGR